jgi:hypothetical protein
MNEQDALNNNQKTENAHNPLCIDIRLQIAVQVDSPFVQCIFNLVGC